MKPQSLFKVALLPLAIAGCGGGGGGLAGIDGSGSPVSTASVSAGPVTGFGSVFVNGRRFVFDGQSAVEIENASGLESQLKVGQFVVIRSRGTDDNGNPLIDKIKTEAELRGPVGAVDTTAGTITVLSQTVRITNGTVFDDSFPGDSVSDVSVGDFVEVSGFRDGQGVITATRLEKEDGAEVKLIGTLSDLSGGTFLIGSQEIDFSSAQLDLDGAILEDGLLVEVEGSLANGILNATEVKLEDSLEDDLKEFENESDDDDREAEIKGVVADFSGSGDTEFTVNGITVRIDDGTGFEAGTAADLANGSVIEVEGGFANGIITAGSIEFENEFEDGEDGENGEDPDRVEVAISLDEVTLLDANTNSARVVTSLGLVGLTDANTRFEDDSDQEIERFGADDLLSGMYVEIEGIRQEDGTLRITEVNREDDEAETEVNGTLDAINEAENTLEIFGISIGVGGQTVSFEDAQENSITLAQFFDQVQPGTEIKVSGTVNGGQLDAREVEIE